MNVLDLTKNLVSIPSFIDKKNNEVVIARFLEELISKEFPGLAINRQFVDQSKKRFNLCCIGSKSPRLLVTGHIDTVLPQSEWDSNPFKPIIKQEKLYGLGTADMKGSIAAFLVALKRCAKEISLKKLMLLFYVDEEYDFQGMKRFTRDCPKINPRIALSLDGKLEVASGCRGCIELDITLRGKSGHSSKPFLGINAITSIVTVVNELEKTLAGYSDRYLGPTTVNLAYLRGGIISSNRVNPVWRREGNVVPDFVDTTIEIRPAVSLVDKNFVVAKLSNLAKAIDIKIEGIRTRHNLGPWPVSYESNELGRLRKVYEKASIGFNKANRMFSGYIDMQMLASKLNAPMFIIGAGGENEHAPKEFVPIKNLKKAQALYEGILQEYCPK